jgi:pantoate--beta-alanine ligase
MKQAAREAQAEGRIVGLVPTMGALHEGHLSLVREARKQCAPVVVSIFVNPKQFGPQEDFAAYPRTFEADTEKLESLGVEFLFAPEAADMYPDGFKTWVSVEGLSERLEGKSRPGHFRGVTTVVLKLLETLRPRFAYFGRKDAQQARIVRQMAADLNLDAEVVVCPIVREADGLALSSRNVYLKSEERRAAAVLYRALDAAGRAVAAGERNAPRLQAVIRSVLQAEPLAATDYVEIVDAETFEPVTCLRRSALALLAVRIGGTRLIDNMLIEPKGESEDRFCVQL